MIDWPGYAQAAATLLTGLAAVVAAVVVGWRQAGIAARQAEISRRQTEILGRQVTLDEVKLRSDVFDRRFAVYQASANLLSDVLVGATTASAECERDFQTALGQSKFLFRPAVHESLLALWAEYCNFGANKSQMRGGPERADWNELVEKEGRQLLAFDERLRNLGTLFGHELVLATPEAPDRGV